MVIANMIEFIQPFILCIQVLKWGPLSLLDDDSHQSFIYILAVVIMKMMPTCQQGNNLCHSTLEDRPLH